MKSSKGEIGIFQFEIVLIDSLGECKFINKDLVDNDTAQETPPGCLDPYKNDVNKLEPYNPELLEEPEPENSVVEYKEKPYGQMVTEYISELETNVQENQIDGEFRDEEWELFGSMDPNVSETIKQQEEQRTLVSRDTIDNPLPALTSNVTNKRTPKVVWRQIKGKIILDICVQTDEPTIKLVRNKIFSFECHYDNNEYLININLFAKVKNEVSYTCGHQVRVTLIKMVDVEWERLTFDKQRFRNIVYGYQPGEKKPKRKLLQIGEDKENAQADEDDDTFVEEYLSDVDYDESDIEDV